MSSAEKVLESVIEGVRKDFEGILEKLCNMYGDLIRRSALARGKVVGRVKSGSLSALFQVYGGLVVLTVSPDIMVMLYPLRVRRRGSRLWVDLGMHVVSVFFGAVLGGKVSVRLEFSSAEEASVYRDYLI